MASPVPGLLPEFAQLVQQLGPRFEGCRIDLEFVEPRASAKHPTQFGLGFSVWTDNRQESVCSHECTNETLAGWLVDGKIAPRNVAAVNGGGSEDGKRLIRGLASTSSEIEPCKRRIQFDVVRMVILL